MRNKNEVILIRPTPAKEVLSKHSRFLPLGLLYLASSLISNGYGVHIVDEENEAAIIQISRLLSNNTLCFGISTMSGTQLANAIIIAKELKARYPQVPLVWGGIHVTLLPEQTLKNELVDYIVWGEGEETFPYLLNAIRNNDIELLHNLPGIGFKNRGNLVIGGNSGYTPLDKMPPLPYHLIDMAKYSRRLTEIGANRDFCIWTSRGCPFRCKFCSNSNSTWPNTKVRYHTLDHIVNDVKTLVNNYGADQIYIGDECFLIDEQRTVSIFEAIKKEGISIKYRIASRVDLLLKIKPQTWEAFREYGVVFVGAGIESGSQRILNKMGKNLTIEQIYQLDALLTKYKFFKGYNFMICTPQETRQDLKETLKLIIDIVSTSLYCPYPLSGTLHKYLPLPGTEMYEEAIRCGFRPPESLADWTNLDFENISDSMDSLRPWISGDDIQYTSKAICLIEKLNYELKGKERTNPVAVKQLVSSINRLILEV